MNRKNVALTARAAIFLLVLILIPFFLPLCASALEPPEIGENSAAILYHNDSGTVLYRNDAGGYLYAGPAARLTAGLVLAEAYAGRTDRIVSVNRLVTGKASSTMNPGLKRGEKIKVYDLLCGALIANSDDAIYALAYDLYEDAEDAPERLLEAMNRRASLAGMNGSKFFDLVGADPQSDDASYSYTCVSDVLLLALEVQKNELLREITSKAEYTVLPTDLTMQRQLLTRNYLLSAKRIPGHTYANATGLCAGYTPQGGSSVIATATIDGRNYTCVVMNVGVEHGAFDEAKTLFEWGHKNHSYKKVLDTSRILGEIEVTLSGDSDYVTVSPESSLSAFLPNDIDVERDVLLETTLDFRKLTAPVHEGLIAGEVRLIYRGKELARTNLITNGSLSLSNSRYYLSLFLNFVRSPIFLYICIAAVAIAIICIFVNARVRYLRKNKPASLDFTEDSSAQDEKIAQSAVFGALGKGEDDESPIDGDQEDAEDVEETDETAEESPAEVEEPAKEPSDGEIGESEKPGKSGNSEAHTAGKAKPEEGEDRSVRLPFTDDSAIMGEAHAFYDVDKDGFSDASPTDKSGRTDYVPDGWGDKK